MELTWVLQTLTVLVIGIVGFFLKATLTDLKEGIIKNDEKINSVEIILRNEVKSVRDELNDLRSDLPFVYVLREDYIRTLNNVDNKMNNIDTKLDKLLQFKGGKCE